MALIDETYTELDRTVRLYDAFYNFDLVVNASQYEIIYAYFLDVSGSKSIARNFSTFLFRISNLTSIDVMQLLEYIKGTTKLEMNGIMAYYLNAIRSKTTLYGIGAEPKPNESVQRNIVV